MNRILPSLAALVLAAGAAAAGDLIPTDTRYGPLRVASHKVEVAVDNQTAITKVEQVFANDNAVQLEGHYLFPVPKGASIIDFAMTIDGKVMRGELLEKDRARAIYEGIVRQSKDPGLLEHAGANLFRVRVFPILPNSTQKIELTYVERVRYDTGLCRIVYPLLCPGGAKTTRAGEFSYRLRLSSLVPLQDISCTTHRADVVRKTDGAAEVTFAGRDVDLSKDLEVAYRIARPSSGMDLAAQRTKEGEGTFMLLVTPQADAPVLPKDMTFVFDTSGSMAGPRIRQAKAALRFCISKLRAEDRFNILTFSSDVAQYLPSHQLATEMEKQRALAHVDRLEETGGTNINDALVRALRHKPEPGRPHLVLFLTDGEPTVGVTDPAQIVRNALQTNDANVRIFAFGVGNGINKGLLEDLADGTRAVAEFVDEKEDIEVKVSALQRKIGSPVLSELAVDWGKAEVSHVYPREPGDLFAGTQLMIAGRYHKAGTFEVVLRGKAGAKPVEIRQSLVFPEKAERAPAVPYLWAMRKVAHLMDGIRKHGENPEVVKELVAVAKEHRIATPYTSFLVLETEQAYAQHGVERRGRDAQPPSAQTRYYRTPADQNTTDDHEEFKSGKGDGMDFVSDKPFKGKGTYDIIGGGGAGGGGRYGSRLGGKRDLVARGGGGGDTEDAVLAALKWLSRNQGEDGSWGDITSTSLALTAFLGAGYSHLSKDTYDTICFGDVVRKGLNRLMGRQDAEGLIGKDLTEHVFAALALSEAYGLTGSNLFKDQAQKAVEYLAANRGGDSWTVGWAAMALRSAELSGLAFKADAKQGVKAWFDSAKDGEAASADMIARIFIDRSKADPRLARGADALLKDLPKAGDCRAWLLGSMALFQYDGPSGPKWRAWNEPMNKALVESQSRDGARKGSWDGKVESTALNALTLEVYYRYPNIFVARQ